MKAMSAVARTLGEHLVASGILCLAVLFCMAQLVPYRVSNPTLRQEPRWDSPRTRALVVAACFDCHSNQSRSYWYTQVAPFSWWTTSHVRSGRATLNFSDWAKHHGEGDITEPVIGGSMPPSYYTWFGLHPDAGLSLADRAALISGLRAIEAKAGVAPNRTEGGGG